MPRVRRSPNYPYVSLEEAIKKTRRIYEEDDSHYAPIDAVASHWKMTTTSSSLGKTIGALLQYGLIEEKGSGVGRQIKVSPRAMDILIHDESEDEHIRALQAAALAPKLHSELWKKYEGRLPNSDHSLRVYLIKDRDEGVFNKDRVDQFLASFRASIKFAGLSDGGTIASREAQGDHPPESLIDRQKPPTGKSEMLELPITLPSLKIAKVSLPKSMTALEFDTFVNTIKAFRPSLVSESEQDTEADS